MSAPLPGVPTPLAGDYVLLGGACQDWCRGNVMRVDEVRSWGCTGTVFGHDEAVFPMRAPWADIVGVWRKVEVRQ